MGKHQNSQGQKEKKRKPGFTSLFRKSGRQVDSHVLDCAQ